MRRWISLLAAALLAAALAGCGESPAKAPAAAPLSAEIETQSSQTAQTEPEGFDAKPLNDGQKAKPAAKAALEQALTTLSSDPESWGKMELLEPEGCQHFQIGEAKAFLFNLCFKEEVENVGGRWVGDYLITEDKTRIYVHDLDREENAWVLKAHEENGDWILDTSL